mmetsp:Transcript_27852/g.52986  ORF Transcript_27852/g.52986 Transcript_27852/m.52986 type:complete len:517 (+) Transcript_27852:145-1695(+)
MAALRASAAICTTSSTGVGLRSCGSARLPIGSRPAFGSQMAQLRSLGIRPQAERLFAVRAATDLAEAAGAIEATEKLAAWRAAIDFKFIKENAELVQQNADQRAAKADVSQVVRLYDRYVEVKQAADSMRQARNASAAKMKGKMDADARQALIEEGRALKDKVAELEVEQAALENELQVEGQRVPNLTHPEVPLGGEENATVRNMINNKPEFAFPVRDHLDIAASMKMLDFETAANVSGNKFYYLTGQGAMLELALVSWAMNKVVGKGFVPHMTPDLVRASVLEKCGFQPRMANTQVYSVEGMDLCLAGTAEIPLGGMYMDKVVEEKDLPVKMVAFGHCFRTEAGAAGSASKGLYRVHQFSKVEMFVLATPEQSDALHEELILLEEEMFGELGLHFKTLDMPSQDLGAPAYRKYDVECWMPGMERYGEISSASNCTDYQSRRLNIRYRPSEAVEDKKGNKKKAPLQFVHTLNATACAVPRMIIAILENFQQEDGTVVVPEVLRPYLGGQALLKPDA